MSLDHLRHLLASVHSGLSDARAHLGHAKELLEESRRVLVDAQAQAQPWLPPLLPQALSQLEKQHGSLAGVDDLLNRYQQGL